MESQSAPQPKLMARWISVDGKLICKWVQLETEKKQDTVLNTLQLQLLSKY